MLDEIARDLGVRAGLVFDHGRRPGLATAVQRRMEALGVRGSAHYAALVLGDGEASATERRELLDAVTIQETYFFRNGPQMRALRHQVLPELVRRAATERRPLRVWSAGCSTGEEPYSLAMLLLDVMEETGLTVPVRIIGTDVAASAVETACRGVYRGRSLHLAEFDAGDRWFVPRADGASVVHDEARALVDVRWHNLVRDDPPFDEGAADLVVCRNVTIYFAKPTTAQVIERFHRTLGPGGYLLLGHAETLWQVSDEFDLLPVGEAFIYRRSEPRLAVPGPAGVGGAVTGSALSGSMLTGSGVQSPAPKRRRVVPRSAPARPRRGRLPVRIIGTEPSGRPLTPGGSVPAEAADVVVAAADQALREGRYQEALDLADHALAQDPLAVEAYAVAGRAAVALGSDDQALEPLRKAVYLDPGCAEAHFTLAGVLARSGQPSAAAAAYRAAAVAVPTTPADRLLRMLDGRDPRSLVDLCLRLAEDALVPMASDLAGTRAVPAPTSGGA
jgi:chemotaxis protein methyltransferase CheR